MCLSVSQINSQMKSLSHKKTIGPKISMMFRITWEIRNVSNIVKEWNRLMEPSVGADGVATDQGHV